MTNITEHIVTAAGGGGTPASSAVDETKKNYSPLADAPSDGVPYARQDGDWISIAGASGGVPDAPVDTTKYARKDGAWVHFTEFTDAPSDGSEYVRKNAAWAVATGGGGGGGTDFFSTTETFDFGTQMPTAGVYEHVINVTGSGQGLDLSNFPEGIHKVKVGTNAGSDQLSVLGLALAPNGNNVSFTLVTPGDWVLFIAHGNGDQHCVLLTFYSPGNTSGITGANATSDGAVNFIYGMPSWPELDVSVNSTLQPIDRLNIYLNTGVTHIDGINAFNSAMGDVCFILNSSGGSVTFDVSNLLKSTGAAASSVSLGNGQSMTLMYVDSDASKYQIIRTTGTVT